MLAINKWKLYRPISSNSRFITAEVKNSKDETYFLKVAQNQLARVQLKAEYNWLRFINLKIFDQKPFLSPKIIKYHHDYLLTEYVAGQSLDRLPIENYFSQLITILNYFKQISKTKNILFNPYFPEGKINNFLVRKVKAIENKILTKKIITKAVFIELLNNIRKNLILSSMFAHGDFKSSNIIKSDKNQQLYLVDCEGGGSNLPAYADAAHFYYHLYKASKLKEASIWYKSVSNIFGNDKDFNRSFNLYLNWITLMELGNEKFSAKQAKEVAKLVDKILLRSMDSNHD